jgi:hypothetical protein
MTCLAGILTQENTPEKNSSGIYVVTGEKKRSIVSVNLRNSGNGTNVFPLHPSF